MQQDMEITTADANTGTTMRTAINNALQALVSLSSGASEPSTTYAYQFWADTTSGYLKIRNAANNAWIQGPKLSDWAASATEKGLIELLTSAEGETGEDTTRAMTAAVNAYINQRGQQLYSASSGTDTYTATLAPVPAALVHGMQINIKFGNASTAASTLNLNSLGAKKIYIQSGSAYVQVGSGDIFAGMNATLSYDSALDSAAGGWVIKNKKVVEATDTNGYPNTACKAYLPVGQAVATGTFTKVQMNIAVYDPGNHYNVVTYEYTVSGSGTQYFLASVRQKYTAVIAAGSTLQAKIYINGVDADNSLSYVWQSDGRVGDQHITGLIKVTGGDVLSFYVFQASGGDRNLDGGINQVFMSLIRVA